MKGGGFIVFLFLLVCFLWGVTSIVGGIRRRIQAWTTPEPSPPQPAPPRPPQTAGVPAAQMRPPLVIDVAPAPVAASTQSKHAQDTVAETLASLREASQLHRSGVLTDAEFAGIKAQLLKDTKS